MPGKGERKREKERVRDKESLAYLHKYPASVRVRTRRTNERRKREKENDNSDPMERAHDLSRSAEPRFPPLLRRISGGRVHDAIRNGPDFQIIFWDR